MADGDPPEDPTAAQEPTAVHDTDESVGQSLADWLCRSTGGVEVDQPAPALVATMGRVTPLRAEKPTAVQSSAAGQLTPRSPPAVVAAPRASARMSHVPACRVATTGRCTEGTTPCDPTAVHAVSDVHETEERWVSGGPVVSCCIQPDVSS